MGRLIVFNNVSLDGYFCDRHGRMDFAHGGRPDPEFDAFTAKKASGGGSLVFGRLTYDLMAAFWPAAAARRQLPEVAAGMSRLTKYVFSRSLRKPAWENTVVVQGPAAAKLRDLKAKSTGGLAILGSGHLVAQIAGCGVVDEYQFVVVPVILGGGRTLFAGLKSPLGCTLVESRPFRNGRIFLRYRPEPA